MPKNLKGGKHKHIKKGTRYQKDDILQLASDIPGSMYAIITKKHGNGFSVLCSNGKTEFAIMRGKFRGKVWLNINDIVLVDASELNMFIIIKKYTTEEVRKLKVKGEITFDENKDTDDNIVFEDDIDNHSDDELVKDINKNNVMNIVIDNKNPNRKLGKHVEQESEESEESAERDRSTKSQELGKSGEPRKPEKPEKSEEPEESGGSEEPDELEDQEEERHKEYNVDDKKVEQTSDNMVKDKLVNKFKNKERGGKGIIRERKRAYARDNKASIIDLTML